MTEVVGDRQSLGSAGRARRRWLWPAAAVLLIAAAVVLFWFQPQKLFIDERVDEAVPSAAAPATSVSTGDAGASAPSEVVEPAEPVELSRGEFVSLDHGTTGVARVIELADGRRILRLEGLATDNGPDLYLYLTATPAAGDESTFDDDHLNLGRLKGNQGDQNYDLPPDATLSDFPTVVIWCDRFNAAFGAADLTAA